jgi:hypothetical protein
MTPVEAFLSEKLDRALEATSRIVRQDVRSSAALATLTRIVFAIHAGLENEPQKETKPLNQWLVDLPPKVLSYKRSGGNPPQMSAHGKDENEEQTVKMSHHKHMH